MDSQESSRFTASLTQRLAEDADARQVAEAVGAMWADIEASLQPVLGHRGVAALLRRTVHVAAVQYPWLAPLKPGSGDATADLTALMALFAAQQPAAAVEAGNRLFTIFRELLTALIGAPLTERLLQAAWSTSSRAASAQDPKP